MKASMHSKTQWFLKQLENYAHILLANHRKAFYRSANAIFGNIGRIASEEIILVMSKCIIGLHVPGLLYGFEACTVDKIRTFFIIFHCL